MLDKISIYQDCIYLLLILLYSLQNFLDKRNWRLHRIESEVCITLLFRQQLLEVLAYEILKTVHVEAA